MYKIGAVKKIGTATETPILFMCTIFSLENRQDKQLAAQNKVTFLYFYVVCRV